MSKIQRWDVPPSPKATASGRHSAEETADKLGLSLKTVNRRRNADIASLTEMYNRSNTIQGKGMVGSVRKEK